MTATVPTQLPFGSVPLSAEWETYRAAIIELQPEAWQTIAPLNSWTVIGSSYAPFRFRYRSAFNEIQIQANLTIGTSTNGVVIGNIPDPYRPPKIQGWPTTGAGTSPKCELDSASNLKMWDYTTGLYVSFNAIVPLDA